MSMKQKKKKRDYTLSVGRPRKSEKSFKIKGKSVKLIKDYKPFKSRRKALSYAKTARKVGFTVRLDKGKRNKKDVWYSYTN